MLRGLLSPGAPAYALNGQLLSFDFPRSISYSQTKQENEEMNPTNFGEMNAGFSSSSQTNANLSFNSTPIPRSSGLSRPRLVKVRKQVNSQNLKSTVSSESRDGPGFNPFRPFSGDSNPNPNPPGFGADASAADEFRFGRSGNEAFVIGANTGNLGGNLNSGKSNSSEFLSKEVTDEMNNLRIGGGNEFGSAYNEGSGFDERVVSQLPEEMMRKLNIEASRDYLTRNKKTSGANLNLNVDNESLRTRDNVTKSVGKSLDSELPNELKIKGKEEVDVHAVVFDASNSKKFETKDGLGTSESVARDSGNVVLGGMKNLNINDTLNTSGVSMSNDSSRVNEKEGFVFEGSRGSGGYSLGDRQNMLSSEMQQKLNIGVAGDDSPGRTNLGFSSAQVFAKNMPAESTNKKDHGFGNPFPMEFSFQSTLPPMDLHTSQVPFEQSQNDMGGDASSKLLFSTSGKHFQTGGYFHGVPLSGKPGKPFDFSFSGKQDVTSTPVMEFKTPNQKGNIFYGLNQNLEFNARREGLGDSKVKRKGKLKQHTKIHQSFGQDFVSRGNSSHENPEVSDAYSPMDISPYQETVGDPDHLTATSVVSDESFRLDSNYVSADSPPAVSNDAIDEDLVVTMKDMDISEGDMGGGGTKGEALDHCSDKLVGSEDLQEESISFSETESFKSAGEELDANIDTAVTSAETEVSSSSQFQSQDSDGSIHFGSSPASEIRGSNFTFAAASTAAQGQHAAPKRNNKKKNWVKVGSDSFNSPRVPYASSLQFSPLTGATTTLSSGWTQKGDPSTTPAKKGDDSCVDKGLKIKDETSVSSAASLAAQEACEKWRLRGNNAYTSGDLSKAEEWYTQGINCVSKTETSRSCLRALMLCYSNRAATRMSLGRMRDALRDCMMAAAIDPNFLRVQVRAANCHLALGEVEDASRYFRKCLQSGSDICVDRKIAVEASEGLWKAQKVSECMLRSALLLKSRTSTEAESALEVIAEALLISSNSEKLLEMKAEALFTLRKYEEVIRLCELSFDTAEKNSPPSDSDGQSTNLDGSEFSKDPIFRVWRCCLIFKSYFYLGRLEDAIISLEKQEKLQSLTKKTGSKFLESSIPLASVVRELLQHKTAGNEAFQSGRHVEAVEHYTAALSCNVDSRPFAAVCFCNRAAAHKLLGQITDAIADCSLAIALDGNYLKAISRRATLYEMIRDYGQAAKDLERLVSLLEKLIEEKTSLSRAFDRSMNLVNDLKQARLRLSEIEEEARKDIPLDMYLILGIERSVSASEIRKAYRKAALRHHPDKAGQSLARNESGDDRIWKEIGEEVHRDADKLFKMIGEAYAVLSDASKRSRYDLEEEMRNAQKKRNGGSASRAYGDTQDFPSERSGNRRNWREVWSSYGNMHSKGSAASCSNRYM